MDREPTTLGEWRDFAKMMGWENAVAFLEEQIAELGENEPVVKDSSQVLYLLAGMG